MRRAVVFACLFLVSGAFAAAQEEVPLVPKPPTASQGKMLVVDAVRTARSLTEVEGKLKGVDEQVATTQKSIVLHNAQHPSGTCTTTTLNPDACDGWINEAKELNTTMAGLVKQKEAQMFRSAQLRGYLNMRLARMRMMTLLDGLTEWEQEVVACARLKKDADRSCLIAAWKHHP